MAFRILRDGGKGRRRVGGNCYNGGTCICVASGAAHPGPGGAQGSGAVAGKDGPAGESLGDNLANNAVLILKNSILAYPATSANAYGPIQDGMNNLSSDNTPVSFPIERRSINPLLLPLVVMAGQPCDGAFLPARLLMLAISGSPAADQQGYPRNGTCDVGAFELRPASAHRYA
jgi:hypothetical protein